MLYAFLAIDCFRSVSHEYYYVKSLKNNEVVLEEKYYNGGFYLLFSVIVIDAIVNIKPENIIVIIFTLVNVLIFVIFARLWRVQDNVKKIWYGIYFLTIVTMMISTKSAQFDKNINVYIFRVIYIYIRNSIFNIHSIL